MDKQTHDKLDEIIKRLDNIERDITDLKRFKNRVLGGLAVFVFIIQSFASYIFGCYK